LSAMEGDPRKGGLAKGRSPLKGGMIL